MISFKKANMDVIGVGISTLDFLLRVPSLEKVTEGCRLIDFDKQGGGVVATAMVTLSRLGAKTGIITAVGNDEYGVEIIEGLKKEGVDTSHVKVLKNHRSITVFVLVDGKTGERRFLPLRQIEDLELNEDDLRYIRSAKILHTDLAFPNASLKALKEAKHSNVLTSLDLGWWTIEVEEVFEDLIGYVDIFIPTKEVALKITNANNPLDAAKILLEMGPKVVGITMGSEGSLCITKDKIIIKEAFKVAVVDTTGAGDVYHGAFLYGLLKKWRLEDVVCFANAVAAMKCMKLGGRAGIPNLDMVEKFLKEKGYNICGLLK